MVVYADVLFVLNLYVTYLLLRLTQTLAHEAPRRGRLVLASLLGGAYALVIFLPLPRWAAVLSEFFAAAVLVLAAFSFRAWRRFLRLYATFFGVSLAFAGVMGALWYFVRPRSLLWFGSVVYYDLSVPLLVGLTIACYALLTLGQKLAALRRPPDALFRLTVTLHGRTVRCDAFLDTGNTVEEPFSAFPTVLIEEVVCAPFLEQADVDYRWIPCRTVGGFQLLRAFRPDVLHLRGVQVDLTTDRVYLALTDTQFKNGAFQALLPPKLLAETPHVREKEGVR